MKKQVLATLILGSLFCTSGYAAQIVAVTASGYDSDKGHGPANLADGVHCIGYATSVMDADVILVLDRGILRESGTHTELLARDGIYASLYRMQFRERQE